MGKRSLLLLASGLTFGLAPGGLQQAGASSCPNLRIGAEVCYSADKIGVAEAQMPVLPLNPTRLVRGLTGLKLSRVIVIHGAGGSATVHSRVDAITYIYGRPPFDASGRLADPWPEKPQGLLLEEIEGRVYTSNIIVDPVAYDSSTPSWGAWLGQTNFPHRNLSVNAMGNFDRSVLVTALAELVDVDSGARPTLTTPSCITIPKARKVSVRLSNVFPDHRFSFELVRHASANHRNGSDPKAHSASLGKFKSGPYGEIRFNTNRLDRAADLGSWNLRARNSSGSVVGSSTIKVLRSGCPAAAASLTLSDPVPRAEWMRGSAQVVRWSGTALVGPVTITVHNIAYNATTTLVSPVSGRPVSAQRGKWKWHISKRMTGGIDELTIQAKTRNGSVLSQSSGQFQIG